jgi:DNA invertase Pin-like site-specific DNA recombinase
LLSDIAAEVVLTVPVLQRGERLENQHQVLQGVAERRGWEVVAVYTDAGISGAKGRAERPGLDDMLKAAIKGGFDVVMAWSIDRLGRSLIDLLGQSSTLKRAVLIFNPVPIASGIQRSFCSVAFKQER